PCEADARDDAVPREYIERRERGRRKQGRPVRARSPALRLEERVLLLDPHAQVQGETLRNSPCVFHVPGEVIRSRLGPCRRVVDLDLNGLMGHAVDFVEDQLVVAGRVIAPTDAETSEVERGPHFDLVVAAEKILREGAERAVDLESIAQLQ